MSSGGAGRQSRWWLKMLAASAVLAGFMLSLAGASWTLAVRRYERGDSQVIEWEGSQFTDWEGYAPVDESEWDINQLSPGELPGLVMEDRAITDWDGYGLVDIDRDGPAPAAVPAGELRRFLRGVWQKVTGDG